MRSPSPYPLARCSGFSVLAGLLLALVPSCSEPVDLGQVQAAGGMVADARGVFVTGGRPETPTQVGLFLLQVDSSSAERIVGGDGVVTLGAQLIGDGTALYYAAEVGGSWGVYQLGREQGAVPRRLATSDASPSSLAVDGTHLYWAFEKGASATLRRVALAGGTGETVRLVDKPVRGVAVDATSIYWTSDNPAIGIRSGWVLKAPKTPGSSDAPVVVARNRVDPGEIAVAGNAVVAVEPVSPAGVCSSIRGTIIRAAIDGTSAVIGASAVEVVTGEYGVGNMAIDGTEVWYRTGLPCGQQSANSSVLHVSVKDALPSSSNTIASGQSTIIGVAVDSTYVYWTIVGTGTTSHAVLRRATR